MTPSTLNVTMFNKTTAQIRGLKANKEYIVQVSAFTSAEEGNNTSLTVIIHKGESH